MCCIVLGAAGTCRRRAKGRYRLQKAAQRIPAAVVHFPDLTKIGGTNALRR